MEQITSASDVSDRLRTKFNVRRIIDFHGAGMFDDLPADKIIFGLIGDQHPFAIIVGCAKSKANWMLASLVRLWSNRPVDAESENLRVK
jgi:hypothetical protein